MRKWDRALGAAALVWVCVGCLGCASSDDNGPPPRPPDGPPGERDPFRRLGYWRFDDPDLVEPGGQRPIAREGVDRVPTFSGTGVRLGGSESGARLGYRLVQPDGDDSIRLDEGAVRFWFRPSWSSGEGPGEVARLIAAGRWTPDASAGYWGVHVNADGSKIFFISQADGEERVHVEASIDWEEGEWNEILLTYISSFVAVEVNDERLRPIGSGMSPVPDLDPEEDGLFVGSHVDGTGTAHGVFDELETFTYRPGADVDLYALNFSLTAEAQTDPPAIALRWKKRPEQPVVIKRRPLGESEWTTLEEGYTQWDYRDDSSVLAPGTRYEYLVHPDPYNPAEGELMDRYIQCEIDPAARHHRGKVLLLVDETLASELETELAQWERDAVGDGWEVLRETAPRHNDDEWEENPPKIEETRALIERQYDRHPDLTTVFLVGHVAIPYSGHIRPDGHHHRPWPVDLYYGDTVRQDDDWTDTESHSGVKDPLRGHEPVPNEPGDGKFDQDRFPSDLELAVGRIDFANLPDLDAGEVPLLKRYLRKVHRYRHGELVYPNRGAALGFMGGSGLGANPNRLLYAHAWKNSSAWWGLNPAHLRQVNCFQDPNAYLWGFQFGAGYYDTIGVGHNKYRLTTADLPDLPDPETGFYILDGSYFGEWDVENNFLRAVLSPESSGLAAMWGRWFKQRWQALGWGASLGETAVRVINHLDERDFVLFRWGGGYNIHMAVLGDPTLRLHVAPPPARLRAEARRDGTIRLRWRQSTRPDARYHVYRSSQGPDGPYERLTRNAVPDTSYIDPNAPAGEMTYQVRAVRQVTTGSGRFPNLSQGAFASAGRVGVF